MIPLALTYRWLRWFHGRSKAVMVPTAGIKQVLEQRGFRNVVLWGRGVDTDIFKPDEQDFSCIVRPLFLYVGRVAVEKNIEDFLRLDLPGTKWVIGDGPQREVWSSAIRTSAFSAPSGMTNSPRITTARTCLFSPAAPIPSGW